MIVITNDGVDLYAEMKKTLSLFTAFNWCLMLGSMGRIRTDVYRRRRGRRIRTDGRTKKKDWQKDCHWDLVTVLLSLEEVHDSEEPLESESHLFWRCREVYDFGASAGESPGPGVRRPPTPTLTPPPPPPPTPPKVGNVSWKTKRRGRRKDGARVRRGARSKERKKQESYHASPMSCSLTCTWSVSSKATLKKCKNLGPRRNTLFLH